MKKFAIGLLALIGMATSAAIAAPALSGIDLSPSGPVAIAVRVGSTAGSHDLSLADLVQGVSYDVTCRIGSIAPDFVAVTHIAVTGAVTATDFLMNRVSGGTYDNFFLKSGLEANKFEADGVVTTGTSAALRFLNLDDTYQIQLDHCYALPTDNP